MSVVSLTLRSFIYRSPSSYLRHASSSSKPTPKQQINENQPKDVTLPLLGRPLGVSERPTTATKTWADKRNELMDQDIRLAQREHLIKEATKGYFTDLNATRRHGGKTWIAPNVMIREDKALYFPDITGTSLDTSETKHTTDICTGRVSVISMLSSRISELHVKGFANPTNQAYNGHPLYQYIQINLQENLLKSFLVSLFLSSVRRSIPPPLHPTYLVSSQNMEYTREPLGMLNKHVGYVYLVDENLKVRWAGCADAKVEEAKALQSCVGVLLGRMDQTKKVNERGANSSHTLEGSPS